MDPDPVDRAAARGRPQARRVRRLGHDRAASPARLVELAAEYGRPQPGGGVRIDLPITQEELASWVGSSREGVNKALHTLRGLRWVETERRAITVLDMDALRIRAG